MNVGVDIRTLQIHSRFQGIGQYSRQLLLHLLRQAAAHERFRLFKIKGMPWGEEEFRGPYECVDLVRPRAYVRLSELLDWGLAFIDYRRRPLDVLHILSIHHLSFGYPCPLVLTIEDLIPLVYPDHYLKTGIKHRMLYRLARRADHIIAISRHTRQDILRLLDVPEDRVSVIYLAPDPSCAPLQDPGRLQEIRSRYRLPEEFILYVGGLALHDPRKRVDLLLESLAELARIRRGPLQLVLAGKIGQAGEELKGLIEKLGIGGRVRLTDYVPPQDLAWLYRAARVFVFPSSYEGFGLPLVEAMACGTPTIAFRNSSIPEVVGEGGLLLDEQGPHNAAALAGAIAAVLSDQGYADELSRRALRQAAAFSWEKTAAETLEVYRRVAGHGR
ncbi:MAG: glycosyltransferase family 1 protein [bacterium]